MTSHIDYDDYDDDDDDDDDHDDGWCPCVGVVVCLRLAFQSAMIGTRRALFNTLSRPVATGVPLSGISAAVSLRS